MTNLPVTFVEAEALAFARQWIEDGRKPNGIFHPDAPNGRFGKPLMKRWIELHPFGADDIAYLAYHGSEPADLALRELIAEYVDRHEPLTAVLAAYNIHVLKPASERKKSWSAKADIFCRDIGITMLVHSLKANFGLAIFKNPASRRPTASTIAAGAVSEAFAMSMTHKGIEKIWGHYSGILTGQFSAKQLAGPFG